MVKLGLALSGGGARGFAHLGAWRALEEKEITPQIISGTSSGALIGAFLASNYKAKEVFKIFKKKSLKKLVHFSVSNQGLLTLGPLKKYLENFFPENDFATLRIPLIVCATDLEKAESIYFTEGPLIEPVVGSCTIPVIGQPYIWQDYKLVDGGVLQNLPAPILQEHAQYIIGVHTNPVAKNQPLKSLRRILEKTLLMAIAVNARQSMQVCHLAIEPPALTNYRIMDFHKIEEIVDIGYQYTKQVLGAPENSALLHSLRS